MSKFLLFLSGLLFVVACDQLQEDVMPTPTDGLKFTSYEKSVYIRPGGEAIIDLSGKLKLSSSARVQIGTQPGKGSLEFLEGGLLRYAAQGSFRAGNDQFIMKIMKDSIVLDQDTIQIVIPSDSTAYPCWVGAVEDFFYFYKDSLENNTTILNVMRNDLMCDSLSAGIRIYTHPKKGTARVFDNRIQYTPVGDFTEKDHFLYQLCQSIEGDSVHCTLARVTFEFRERSPVDTTNCVGPPVAIDDYLVIQADSISSESSYTAMLDVVANDSICDDVRMLGVHVPPSNGRHEIINNILYYTYPKSFVGVDSLQYIICNSDSLCAPAKVWIEVK